MILSFVLRLNVSLFDYNDENVHYDAYREEDKCVEEELAQQELPGL